MSDRTFKFFVCWQAFAVCIGLLLTPSFEVFAKTSAHYKKQLQRFSRDDEIYQREDFHASLKWHATVLTDEFLQSWADENARIYDSDLSQKKSFLFDLRKKYQDYDVFFVSFYSYSFRESDLANPKSVWHLSLQTSQGQFLEPVRIEKLTKPTSYDQHIFPYIDIWSQCYFVFFPKGSFDAFIAGSDDLTLKIAGPTGKGLLVWKN